MNQLPLAKRVAVVSALVEGNSLRSTCRMTGVAMNTVLKLLAALGTECAAFHNEQSASTEGDADPMGLPAVKLADE